MTKQHNIVISGFGGQGILFLGTILAHAAMIEGKNTTWIPSYGAEMRGGAASCFVTISDGEIASPVFDFADVGVFLSKQALDKYKNSIKENGVIIADSTNTGEIKEKNNLDFIFRPFSDLIMKENQKLLLNVVVLGAFVKKTGILMKNSVIKALEKISSVKKPEFLELNLKSFEYGYSLL